MSPSPNKLLELIRRRIEQQGPMDLGEYMALCLGHPEFMDDTPLLHRAGWQENAETEWQRR